MSEVKSLTLFGIHLPNLVPVFPELLPNHPGIYVVIEDDLTGTGNYNTVYIESTSNLKERIKQAVNDPNSWYKQKKSDQRIFYKEIDNEEEVNHTLQEAIYYLKPKYNKTHWSPSQDKKENQNITYYINNVSGSNVRINQNTIDNSINIVNTVPDVQSQLDLLKSEIEQLSINESEKQSALELASAVEDQFNSKKPNKTVIKTLIDALPPAANIASIGSFLLSCIGL